jgi:hypothetical protein
MMSPAFLMVQDSIEDVLTFKRETTGANGPRNHESLSYPFVIHDSRGNTATLNIGEVWELLEWLDDRHDALFRELHPESAAHSFVRDTRPDGNTSFNKNY